MARTKTQIDDQEVSDSPSLGRQDSLNDNSDEIGDKSPPEDERAEATAMAADKTIEVVDNGVEESPKEEGLEKEE